MITLKSWARLGPLRMHSLRLLVLLYLAFRSKTGRIGVVGDGFTTGKCAE